MNTTENLAEPKLWGVFYMGELVDWFDQEADAREKFASRNRAYPEESGERELLPLYATPAAPDLQSIEQYRMQMAGISSAALGYWQESDSIHPDYDTVALRDVAKLYAKYDKLYKAAGHAPKPAVQGEAQDAARYRWLAAHCRSTPEHWRGRWSIVIEGPAPERQDCEDAFDAAIDAAMQAQEGGNV